jgi:Xaa-Pro aminopeptidase
VGLQIHEGPWLGTTQDNVLAEGAVVTVEPGIYVDGIGGVRIEDMVEITADGCEVVGASSRDMIEL